MLLLIRADATTNMGTGHLVRCAAIAESWQAEGGESVFITQCDSPGLLQRIRGAGARVAHVSDPCDLEPFRNARAARVVLDGYHFDPPYQERIQSLGLPVLVIDDLAHLSHYHADAILNQNSYANRLPYSCEPAARLLLGTRYALLRSEFLPWDGVAKETKPLAKNILVTLGGSDPHNVTPRVIEALHQVRHDLEITIVAGAANPHLDEIRALSATLRNARLVVNARNMAELMHWADLAVTAAGTTCWELSFMRVPMITVVVADNQEMIGSDLQELGVAWNLGVQSRVSVAALAGAVEALVEDTGRRAQMAQRGGDLVDGLGVRRVTGTLRAM
jgi:UDP-2,4-diacetamido-2,4,6-trideoxy-beta-L-altropyranose hydrolase